VGRPKEHDEETRLELLDAAERIIEEGGPGALSVRAVADAIGVSTRAVYSTFGSKDGLLDALSQRAFELLTKAISELPQTEHPDRDLVEAAVRVFRPMAIGHPSLFRLALLRVVPELDVSPDTRTASQEAFGLLIDRFRRLEEAGLLVGHDPRAAAAVFNALCEGMATTELRMAPSRFGPDPEQVWRRAVTVLIAGFARPTLARD
jgi:AcrR family transcriptional regulator